MDLEKTRRLIARRELFRQFVYNDKTSLPVKTPKGEGKLTVGYGMNLEDGGMPEPVARFALEYTIKERDASLKRHISFYSSLDDVRQAVLLSMAYQMGIPGLLKFSKTIDLMKAKKWSQASSEMRVSEWAKQCSERVNELSLMMYSGEWPNLLGVN